jgi:hypothetical protein
MSFPGSLDVEAFADRLWGDIYFNEETRKFTRKQADPEQNRSFVHFILEPLYKLYSNVLSEDTDTLKETLNGLNIHLKPVMYKMDVRPLLKAVLDQFFGPATGLVDMIVEKIPSPLEGASNKVRNLSAQMESAVDCHSGRRNIQWSANIGSGGFDEVLQPRRSCYGPSRKIVSYDGCAVFQSLRSCIERYPQERHGYQGSRRRVFTRR